MRKYKMLFLILFVSVLAFCTACNESDANVKADSTEEITEEVDDDLDIADTMVVSETEVNFSDYEGVVEIAKGGTYHLTGTLEGMLYINTSSAVILKLDGVTIQATDGPAIYARDTEELTLEMVKDTSSSLVDAEGVEYATLDGTIYSKSDLVFKGEGTLRVTAETNHAIVCKDSASFEEGTYIIDAAQDCIHVNDDLVVDGGTFTLTAVEDECIQSETNAYINGGVITCTSSGDAIKAENELEINGGVIDIPQADEGLESKNALVINGGKIDITSIDDCINAANSITVNGGVIRGISSTNDVMDSNGTLEMNGGDIYAIGLQTPEGSFDCDGNAFAINGGNVFGIGAVQSTPSESSLVTLLVEANIVDVIGTVEIKDENDKVVYSCEVEDYSEYKNKAGAGMVNNNGEGELTTEEMPTMPEGEMQEPPTGEQGEMPAMPEGGMKEPPTGEQGEMPTTETNEANTATAEKAFSGRGGKMNGGMNGGGMAGGSQVLFISTSNLNVGNTYKLYINGELVETITISENIVTIGSTGMGGGMNGGKINNGKFQNNQDAMKEETTEETESNTL